MNREKIEYIKHCVEHFEFLTGGRGHSKTKQIIEQLQQKNRQLEKRIKKALDFIDSKVISNGEIIDQLRKIEVKELIEILNGKSDE